MILNSIELFSASERVPIDFHHHFTVEKNKSFRLPIRMVFMISLRPMVKATPQKKHFAKRPTHESENENYQEEVFLCHPQNVSLFLYKLQTTMKIVFFFFFFLVFHSTVDRLTDQNQFV